MHVCWSATFPLWMMSWGAGLRMRISLLASVPFVVNQSRVKWLVCVLTIGPRRIRHICITQVFVLAWIHCSRTGAIFAISTSLIYGIFNDTCFPSCIASVFTSNPLLHPPASIPYPASFPLFSLLQQHVAALGVRHTLLNCSVKRCTIPSTNAMPVMPSATMQRIWCMRRRGIVLRFSWKKKKRTLERNAASFAAKIRQMPLSSPAGNFFQDLLAALTKRVLDRHNVCCVACAARLKLCPMCRVPCDILPLLSAPSPTPPPSADQPCITCGSESPDTVFVPCG